MSRRSAFSPCWILLMASALVAAPSTHLATPASADEEFFESRIRPLLATHCWDCHSEDNIESELRLDSRLAMLAGGTRGPAIVPGKPDESVLVHAIRHSERLQMPPKAKLGARQIADVVQWIQLGAAWPNQDLAVPQSTRSVAEYRLTDEDREFWAFRPPLNHPLPRVRRREWIQSPIDHFILAGLEAKELRPARPAEKRALVRRATFDLLGLPPTPAEVQAFLADTQPGAFARLVDRLLASPRYGERWGRHWLDVARYADSNGLDENLAFANAYRYRDYVIRAFNVDKPFDRFVHEQLAGDLLGENAASEPFDRIVATGFLSLGAKMLAEDDPVKMQMDIIDEQIDTIGRSFMGLTLGCARCHDHKFDPIPITDYYSIAGILKSTKTMDHFDVVAKWQERELATKDYLRQHEQHEQQVRQKQSQVDELVAAAQQQVVARAKQHAGDYLLAAVQATAIRPHLDAARSFGSQSSPLPAGHHLVEAEDFVRGNVLRDSDNYGVGIGVLVNKGQQPNRVEYEIECETVGWYQLEIRYASLEPRPCVLFINGTPLEQPVASGKTGGWQPDAQKWHVEAIVQLHEGKNILRLEQPSAFPHIDKLLFVPLHEVPVIDVARVSDDYQVIPPFVSRWNRYLNSTDQQGSPLLLKFREVAASPTNVPALRAFAIAYGQQFAAVAKQLATDDDSTQAVLRRLLDDPQGPFAVSESLEAFFAENTRLTLRQYRKELEELRKAAPTIPTAMGVTDLAQPENVRVHLRGSHLTLGPEVPRRFLRVIASDDEFPIPERNSGRLELAHWLTHPSHPLTARVMANRIWQWHFGAGLVQSADNFGRLGQRPSHPKLLDWLALRLIESEWSIKAMHRLLMNSSTYQMSTVAGQPTEQADPDNRYLSHFNRRRLEAEAVRDSVLAVSGDLDLSMGGSLLRTPNRAYVTSTANVNPIVYQSRGRSVYLPVVRSALYEVLQSFDFPDPSVTTGKRQTTTVAPQALFMMNSELVSNQARQMARLLLADHRLDDAQRVELAYSRAYSRLPDREEVESALRYLCRYALDLAAQQPDLPSPRERAWQSLCRAILSANEFIYVE